MEESKTIILSIETSTDVCSAALSQNGETIFHRRIDTPRMQSSALAPMIESLLEESGLKAKDCSAVAVSSGPGSYTGLRVGVSLAKGFCFGGGIPLIGVGTLDIIAAQGRAYAAENGLDVKFIVPMIDARRMEVYQAVYDAGARRTGEIAPLILEPDSYGSLLSQGGVLFCGDGCGKFSGIAAGTAAKFFPCNPDARFMAKLSYDKFLEGKFENTAYMEPFYLKEFSIGISKKKILG